VPITVARAAAAAALLEDRAEGVTRALRETVRSYIDVRVFDPDAVLPGRSSKTSLPADPPSH
jgi:hypothetical protein